MAVAKAECTCSTCGSKFIYRKVVSNSSSARSFEEWASANITECEDCRARRLLAAREEENARNAEISREMGYPELKGTEKQVSWATTIREGMMGVLREYYSAPERAGKYPEMAKMVLDGLSGILLAHTSAAWWIENRCRTVREIFAKLRETDKDACAALEARMQGKEPEAPKQEPKAAEPEKTEVRPTAEPENRKHSGAADVKAEGDTVTAAYDRDERFRTLVKGMGFTWSNGRWEIAVSETHGSADNIIAELGSRLLNDGFAVRFDSQELLRKAVSGDYTPMHHRWIWSNDKGFYITWAREDDHYRAAKSLPGATYSSPGVVVPERSWDAVMDFAEKFGYSMTMAAREKMDRLSGAASTVSPAPAKAPEYNEQNVLNSSREIIPDLKD